MQYSADGEASTLLV